MNCEDGGIKSGKLSKLKKKLHKSFNEPPSAMRNSDGELLTRKQNILDETVKYYCKVLENRKIKEGLENHQNKREDLAKARMNIAKEKRTEDWDIEYLEAALKGLKKDKSSDALGYINEHF